MLELAWVFRLVAQQGLVPRPERQHQQALAQRQAWLVAPREEQAEARVPMQQLVPADRLRKQRHPPAEARHLRLKQEHGIHARLQGAELVQHQVPVKEPPRVHQQNGREEQESEARSQHRQVAAVTRVPVLKPSDLEPSEVINRSTKMRRASLVLKLSNLALAKLRRVKETRGHITARKQKNAKAVVLRSDRKGKDTHVTRHDLRILATVQQRPKESDSFVMRPETNCFVRVPRPLYQPEDISHR